MRTPVAAYDGWEIASQIALAPVLRSGIGMVGAMEELLPHAKGGCPNFFDTVKIYRSAVHYLGLFRDKSSLSPVEYFSKLPQKVGRCSSLLHLKPV